MSSIWPLQYLQENESAVLYMMMGRKSATTAKKKKNYIQREGKSRTVSKARFDIQISSAGYVDKDLNFSMGDLYSLFVVLVFLLPLFPFSFAQTSAVWD